MAISAQHTQFVTSPYINALPAEDLIKVALKKQEMYDEGKKQIKQNLDNYGKLRSNIINENERNYFDQELNKMVKNVQQNAGLDFSNMSNVEAVINLGKPFENDNYIKTALDNGTEYQRRQKELASVPKEKRNADNDLVYMYDIQKHIESGGLGQKLQKNSSYTQYVDIKKKLADIEKDVQGEMSTIYRQGPAGYIEKVDIERKTREQIANRISQSLTPDEQAQIQVHAQAQMYRMGSDVVYQTWVGANKEEALMAEQESKKAMYALGDLRKVKNPTAQQLADIRNAERVIKEAQDIKAATKANIDMDPDQFDMGEYLPFFTNRFISGIAGNQVKEVIKSDLKEDKVYLKNMEHRQTMSEISARGAQDRLSSQFEFDQENYSVNNTVSLGTLNRVTNYMSKGFKVDATKTPSAQIDQVINQLYNLNNEKAQKLSPAQVELYVRELKSLQTVYRSYEGTTGSKDKVSLNRSQGLGKVETSIDDLLTRPVTDIFNSGLTLEVLKFREDLSGGSSKSTSGGKSAAVKAQEKLEELAAKSALANPNNTAEQNLQAARDAMNREIKGAGNKSSGYVDNPNG
jgi:hypothetical protein